MLTGTFNALELKISQFEGPLDLLCHLIEKNRIDIYDIPIIQITDQYLAYLDSLQSLDMELASEFLVMAATLLHIKSRMLLPQKETLGRDGEEDPREELVLRLLEYRRCKTLASDLRERHDTYTACLFRLPESPVRLGIPIEEQADSLSWDSFWQACQQIARQNQLRFNDLSSKITHILKREKVSLKEKMRLIWRSAANRSRIFFNELFPAGQTSKAELVTGFLALLELLRLNKIRARQERPFDVILLESDLHQPIDDDDALNKFLAEATIEEKDYD
ncbi:MAG TPA: chromosome segregation protein ScpA [Clostridiales bacterium]|nr:chromosome segregation protein ScpA [Clostridiales bacterium]